MVTQLKRIYYETAAILPACSRIIGNRSGSVTEYLGDGLLAFFRVDKDDKSAACYSSRFAAIDCLKAMTEIINPILVERYELPTVQIGIGMSVSDTIITVTGQGNFLKPTAFGKCVFYATKLSKGYDEVIVDEALKLMWPTSEDGKWSFRPHRTRGVDGYLMYSNPN